MRLRSIVLIEINFLSSLTVDERTYRSDFRILWVLLN